MPEWGVALPFVLIIAFLLWYAVGMYMRTRKIIELAREHGLEFSAEAEPDRWSFLGVPFFNGLEITEAPGADLLMARLKLSHVMSGTWSGEEVSAFDLTTRTQRELKQYAEAHHWSDEPEVLGTRAGEEQSTSYTLFATQIPADLPRAVMVGRRGSGTMSWKHQFTGNEVKAGGASALGPLLGHVQLWLPKDGDRAAAEALAPLGEALSEHPLPTGMVELFTGEGWLLLRHYGRLKAARWPEFLDATAALGARARQA